MLVPNYLTSFLITVIKIGESDNFEKQMFYLFPFFRSRVMRASAALGLITCNSKSKASLAVLIYKGLQKQQSNNLI